MGEALSIDEITPTRLIQAWCPTRDPVAAVRTATWDFPPNPAAN